MTAWAIHQRERWRESKRRQRSQMTQDKRKAWAAYMRQYRQKAKDQRVD